MLKVVRFCLQSHGGTLKYQAPEIKVEEGLPYNGVKGDVYALGVTMLEWFVCHKPDHTTTSNPVTTQCLTSKWREVSGRSASQSNAALDRQCSAATIARRRRL